MFKKKPKNKSFDLQTTPDDGTISVNSSANSNLKSKHLLRILKGS